MSSAQSGSDLLTALARAEAALTGSDADGANGAMAEAAEICRQLQGTGTPIPASELRLLQDMAQRCGRSLMRLQSELNAESQRDDNHRRGVLTYQAGQRR